MRSHASLPSRFHLRTAVVFRDPRDVVISERRMKLEVYHRVKGNKRLLPFIERRFEVYRSDQGG